MSRPIIHFNAPEPRGLGYDDLDEPGSYRRSDGAATTETRPRPHRNGVGGARDAFKRRRERNPLVLDFAAMFAEFIGTFMFLWLSFMGAQAAIFNRELDGDGLMYSNQTMIVQALSFGMSLLVTTWVFFRISGAIFNPAVTLALWLVGNVTGLRAILVFIAQLVGGITAAAVTRGLALGPFSIVCTTAKGLGAGTGMAIEMFTTAMLVLTVLMLLAEKHRGTFLAPVAIGLSLFVGQLAALTWTSAGMNPARCFGPSVVSYFPGNAWLYYVGEFLGALLAVLVYVIVKNFEYSDIVAHVDSVAPENSQSLGKAPIAGILPASSLNNEIEARDARAAQSHKEYHENGGANV